ncbi:hypothetical protein RND71_035048 [Anisodus tanguticus]|uniref:Uncharacterized protein n=1 Tax=Anisodus tanguticus TaxID=243964 RepID=A0AAE1UVH5_9SOLA|nr:hypothetical protein RND71_035048 [Anisodus tanguticus]
MDAVKDKWEQKSLASKDCINVFIWEKYIDVLRKVYPKCILHWAGARVHVKGRGSGLGHAVLSRYGHVPFVKGWVGIGHDRVSWAAIAMNNFYLDKIKLLLQNSLFGNQLGELGISGKIDDIFLQKFLKRTLRSFEAKGKRSKFGQVLKAQGFNSPHWPSQGNSSRWKVRHDDWNTKISVRHEVHRGEIHRGGRHAVMTYSAELKKYEAIQFCASRWPSRPCLVQLSPRCDEEGNLAAEAGSQNQISGCKSDPTGGKKGPQVQKHRYGSTDAKFWAVKAEIVDDQTWGNQSFNNTTII